MILLTALDTTNRFQTIFQIYDHIPQKRKKEIFATLFKFQKLPDYIYLITYIEHLKYYPRYIITRP